MNRLKHAHLETARTSKKEPLTEEITRASYTNEEIGLIKSQRELLIKKDLNDEAISIELSKHLNHPARSIREKIRFLIKTSQLPENPNNRKDFTEEDVQAIINQRAILIEQNITDRAISTKLSKQLNHSMHSIDQKIRELIKSGRLPGNPNKQKQDFFDLKGLQLISSQRELLINQGLTDSKISKELSKHLHRSVTSIGGKVLKLVQSGQLPENPNRREVLKFSDEVIQIIATQRSLLITKNLTDKEISRELSKQLNRPADGIRQKIRQLVKLEQLPENPNKREQEGFTDQEIQTIISQRQVLITKNLSDHEISKELSKLLGRSARSIEAKVRSLVKSGQLTENPNKREHEGFSDEEIQTIASQRPSLIAKNLADKEISRELSKQLNRSVGGISGKIHRLVQSGQLPVNPNKKEQDGFTDQELQTIISQRPSLIAKNLTDGEISRELSKLIGHSAGGISQKIHQLVKSGKLPENPNKLGRKPTENELLSQLVNAVDAYTGKQY